MMRVTVTESHAHEHVVLKRTELGKNEIVDVPNIKVLMILEKLCELLMSYNLNRAMQYTVVVNNQVITYLLRLNHR